MEQIVWIKIDKRIKTKKVKVIAGNERRRRSLGKEIQVLVNLEYNDLTTGKLSNCQKNPWNQKLTKDKLNICTEFEESILNWDWI